MREFHFEIFADYFQFCVQDENAVFDYSRNIWEPPAIEHMVAVTPGMIHVQTARNTTLHITVEIGDSGPQESSSTWDHITEGSIKVPSGTLAVVGTTDYFPDAPRIKISPGTYRFRVFYGNLRPLRENDLEGDDHYKVFLWPGEEIAPRVLKAKADGLLSRSD